MQFHTLHWCSFSGSSNSMDFGVFNLSLILDQCVHVGILINFAFAQNRFVDKVDLACSCSLQDDIIQIPTLVNFINSWILIPVLIFISINFINKLYLLSLTACKKSSDSKGILLKEDVKLQNRHSEPLPDTDRNFAGKSEREKYQESILHRQFVLRHMPKRVPESIPSRKQYLIAWCI